MELIAAALPDVQSDQAVTDEEFGPEHSWLDMVDEWFTSPREMAEHIVANLPPGVLNVEKSDAE